MEKGNKQKKPRGKRLLIASLIFLSIFVIMIIGARFLSSSSADIIYWTLLGISIFISALLFGIWLIGRLGKKIVFPIVGLIVIVIIGYFAYGVINTKQKTEVCKQVMPMFENSFNLQYDVKKTGDKTKSDMDKANGKWTTEQVKTIIADLKDEKSKTNSYSGVANSILDVLQKEFHLFSSSSFEGIDFGTFKKGVIDMQNARVQSYDALINYYQAISDQKPQNEIQALYKETNAKINTSGGFDANFQSNHQGTLEMAGHGMYYQCHELLKIKEPAKNFDTGLSFW